MTVTPGVSVVVLSDVERGGGRPPRADWPGDESGMTEMGEHRVALLGASWRRSEDPATSRDPRMRAVVGALATLPAPPMRAEFRAELRAQLVAITPRIVAESAPADRLRPDDRHRSGASPPDTAGTPRHVRAAARRRLPRPVEGDAPRPSAGRGRVADRRVLRAPRRRRPHEPQGAARRRALRVEAGQRALRTGHRRQRSSSGPRSTSTSRGPGRTRRSSCSASPAAQALGGVSRGRDVDRDGEAHRLHPPVGRRRRPRRRPPARFRRGPALLEQPAVGDDVVGARARRAASRRSPTRAPTRRCARRPSRRGSWSSPRAARASALASRVVLRLPVEHSQGRARPGAEPRARTDRPVQPRRPVAVTRPGLVRPPPRLGAPRHNGADVDRRDAAGRRRPPAAGGTSSNSSKPPLIKLPPLAARRRLLEHAGRDVVLQRHGDAADPAASASVCATASASTSGTDRFLDRGRPDRGRSPVD